MLEQDQKWVMVTLRLSGDRLPLDDIGGLLGIRPSSVGRDGEPIGGRAGRAKSIGDTWCWRLPAESSLSMETQIALVLDIIEPKRAELEQLLRETRGEADLFVGFSSGNGQGGAYLSVDLLRRVVSLNLSLMLDLYPPSIETE